MSPPGGPVDGKASAEFRPTFSAGASFGGEEGNEDADLECCRSDSKDHKEFSFGSSHLQLLAKVIPGAGNPPRKIASPRKLVRISPRIPAFQGSADGSPPAGASASHFGVSPRGRSKSPNVSPRSGLPSIKAAGRSGTASFGASSMNMGKALSSPDGDDDGCDEFTFGTSSPLQLPDAAQLQALAVVAPDSGGGGFGLRRNSAGAPPPQIVIGSGTPRSAIPQSLSPVNEQQLPSLPPTPPPSLPPSTPSPRPPSTPPPQAMFMPGFPSGACQATGLEMALQVMQPPQYASPPLQMPYTSPQMLVPPGMLASDYSPHTMDLPHTFSTSECSPYATTEIGQAPGQYHDFNMSEDFKAHGAFQAYLDAGADDMACGAITYLPPQEEFWDCCSSFRMKLFISFGCIGVLVAGGAVIMAAAASVT